MATLGITYFLDGFGQTIFGSDIYKIDIGMPKDPIFLLEGMFQGGVLVNKEDVYRRGDRRALVAALSAFFQYTSTGRALRAVADDHQAAQSIGIPLNRIWVIVWSVAGFVALVAGIIWGSKLGVQFSLSPVALKALPVVILGGLTSVPGAIIGGLIIGVGEKLSEVFIGPMWAAASRSGSPMCWRCFLLVRPQGLFGEKIIDPRLRQGGEHMLYRENGQFKTSYRADQQIFPIAQDRIASLLLLAVAFLVVSRCWPASTCSAPS
jgi:branched-chain amino acid transport system permease protein